MKKLLIVTSLIATVVSTKADCILLEWSGTNSPSTNTIEMLADTQNPADRQEIRDWFLVKHENGFILSSSHTNAINAAISEGATAKVVSKSSSIIHPIFGKK